MASARTFLSLFAVGIFLIGLLVALGLDWISGMALLVIGGFLLIVLVSTWLVRLYAGAR